MPPTEKEKALNDLIYNAYLAAGFVLAAGDNEAGKELSIELRRALLLVEKHYCIKKIVG